MKITAENEEKLVKDLLLKIGSSEEDASIVAKITLNADLKGFSSHGLGRFSQYIIAINEGNINLTGEPTIDKETISTALINGNNLFGHVIGYKSMKLAMKKAKETGVGLVGTHDANHFGVTGYYSDMAAKEDMIGMVIANTEPAVAPLGGKKAILGTNPIAISIPSKYGFVAVDMATSASARGKLIEAQRKGEQLPPDVALDENGKATTDPTEALKGSILPFGTHKGFGLAFMIEILSGPLVDAAYGSAVTGTANPRAKCNKGDLYFAIDPSKFRDIDEFKDEVHDLCEELRSAGENIIIPGDLERRNMKKIEKEGIPIDIALYETLKDILNNYGLNIDDYLDKTSNL